MKTSDPAIMAMPRLMKIMEQQLKMQALTGNKQDSVYSLLAERAAKATMATHFNENRFQKIFDEQRKFNEIFRDKYFPWLRQYNLNYIGSNRIIDELTKKHRQWFDKALPIYQKQIIDVNYGSLDWYDRIFTSKLTGKTLRLASTIQRVDSLLNPEYVRVTAQAATTVGDALKNVGIVVELPELDFSNANTETDRKEIVEKFINDTEVVLQQGSATCVTDWNDCVQANLTLSRWKTIQDKPEVLLVLFDFLIFFLVKMVEATDIETVKSFGEVVRIILEAFIICKAFYDADIRRCEELNNKQ